jgi:hypothetical protein
MIVFLPLLVWKVIIALCRECINVDGFGARHGRLLMGKMLL